MLATILTAPFRHWGKALLLWVLLVGAVVVVTALTPERFKSESKLFVRLGRENAALDPTATIGHGSVIALPPSREYELNSVVDVLKSRGMAEKVVDRLGIDLFLTKPTTPPADAVAADETTADEAPTLAGALWQKVNPLQATPQRERALRNFGELLSVGTAKKSNIINLAFEHPSPHEAQRVLETLIEIYIDEHLRLNRTPGSHEFLLEQAEELKQRLSSQEDQLREVKNQGSVTALVEQERLLQSRASSLEDQLFAAKSSLAVSEARIESLEKTLKDVPATRVASTVEGHPNQAADLVRQQLYALELEEQALLSKFTIEHPHVKQVQQQLAEARAIAAKVPTERAQTTTAPVPAYDQLQLDLLSARVERKSLNAKSETLVGQLAETHKAISALNDRGLAITRLARDVAALDASYREYLESIEQTRLDQALEAQQMSNVSIAQDPTLELRAVRPRRLKNYALGVAFATIASLALTILIELTSSRVRTPQQLADELEVSALVSIPRSRQTALSTAARRPR